MNHSQEKDQIKSNEGPLSPNSTNKVKYGVLNFLRDCFCDSTFWTGKQKLFIAYRLLLFFVFMFGLVLLGSFILVAYSKLGKDSGLFELITIVIYGGFNIISLTIGFVAGASLDGGKDE